MSAPSPASSMSLNHELSTISKRAAIGTITGDRRRDKYALKLKIDLPIEGLIVIVLNGSLNW